MVNRIEQSSGDAPYGYSKLRNSLTAPIADNTSVLPTSDHSILSNPPLGRRHVAQRRARARAHSAETESPRRRHARTETLRRVTGGGPSLRASTSLWRDFSEKDTDGRDKPAMTTNNRLNMTGTRP